MSLDGGVSGRKRRWISIKIDDETYEMLQVIGEEEGIMSVSSVVKYIAKQYIRERPYLRSRLMKEGGGTEGAG
jgi:metal-responsive CopG/Arc/MetJ family transcriptional regulator